MVVRPVDSHAWPSTYGVAVLLFTTTDWTWKALVHVPMRRARSSCAKKGGRGLQYASFAQYKVVALRQNTRTGVDMYVEANGERRIHAASFH